LGLKDGILCLVARVREVEVGTQVELGGGLDGVYRGRYAVGFFEWADEMKVEPG
jgi:hypothetical protein